MTTPTKTPHTKLPWKGNASVIWSPDGKAVIAAVSDLRATSTVQFTPLSISSDDFEEAYANRDFILLAVNNHDKLVEALKAFARCGSVENLTMGRMTEIKQAQKLARSVLASLSDGQ